MPLPKRRTWFLIADGAKARLFESKGPKARLTLKCDWSNPNARMMARDLGRERPVRGRTIGTGAPYAVDAPSPHEKAETAFVAARAVDINEGHKKGAFDQLIIAAPPSALGLLRKNLTPEVAAKMVGAFDKDLTNYSDRDLHAYFLDNLERW